MESCIWIGIISKNSLLLQFASLVDTEKIIEYCRHPRISCRICLILLAKFKHDIFFLRKMHFSYVKSNILWKWLNMLRNYVHARTFFTPKIHPPPITRPATRPCPPPDPARHQTRPATHPAHHPTRPATQPTYASEPQRRVRDFCVSLSDLSEL